MTQNAQLRFEAREIGAFGLRYSLILTSGLLAASLHALHPILRDGCFASPSGRGQYFPAGSARTSWFEMALEKRLLTMGRKSFRR